MLENNNFGIIFGIKLIGNESKLDNNQLGCPFESSSWDF